MRASGALLLVALWLGCALPEDGERVRWTVVTCDSHRDTLRGVDSYSPYPHMPNFRVYGHNGRGEHVRLICGRLVTAPLR